jgi:sialate O-acetylesterase
MHGVGRLADAVSPDDRVWSFSSAGQWKRAEEPLHTLWESYTPCHLRVLEEQGQTEASDDEKVFGAGLGLPFGKLLAETLEKPIGLIPAAHGGTSLAQWSPNGPDPAGETLYGGMLRRVREAGGILRGVLWYQGESDTAPELAPTYAERLAHWIDSVRRDVSDPTLPIFLVQLGPVFAVEEFPFQPEGWDTVRAAQLAVAAADPNVRIAPALDTGLVDIIHLHAGGLKRVGARLARQALELVYRHPAGADTARPVRVSLTGAKEIRIEFDRVNGRWQGDDIGGFSVGGHANAVTNARASGSDIILTTAVEPSPRAEVFYGRGLHPRCTATDSFDMGLCAFASELD